MTRTERDRETALAVSEAHQAAIKLKNAVATPRHRHERTSWVIAGGAVEWCYQCGAWRSLRPVNAAGNVLTAITKWQRPSGIGGPNPALKETT